MMASSSVDYRKLKFIFIGGTHKSGTTLVQRLLSENEDISGFRQTGAFEDEGQHLQSELKSDPYFGELLFGLSKEAYLTEEHFNSDPDIGKRLFQSWKAYWDLRKRYLLEKSPINIVRTRFLQQAFPDARFILIIRDPRTLYMASRKNLPLVGVECFFDNWLRVYSNLMIDKQKLKRVLLVRYEDLMFSTEAELCRVSDFLEFQINKSPVKIDSNQDLNYQKQWNAFFEKNRSALQRIDFPEWYQEYGYETELF